MFSDALLLKASLVERALAGTVIREARSWRRSYLDRRSYKRCAAGPTAHWVRERQPDPRGPPRSSVEHLGSARPPPILG
jgi:hypothetical protein